MNIKRINEIKVKNIQGSVERHKKCMGIIESFECYFVTPIRCVM